MEQAFPREGSSLSSRGVPSGLPKRSLDLTPDWTGKLYKPVNCDCEENSIPLLEWPD